jgi:DNA ligase D-like protein (predicted polymerase)
VTKLDVARYYDAIGSWIVPHVAGRPLTLVRCPEGLAGECFFMKHSQVWAPEALRRVRIQEKKKLGEYLIADDVAGIVSLAQMGVLEIHTWNALIDDIERPNRIVIDLDPGEQVTWSDVIAAARTVRKTLKALELESWVKTTGGRGLHVVVPLQPHADWTACLEFTRALSEALVRANPGRYTSRQNPSRLPPQQPHEHIHCRLLDARASRRACQRTGPVGGSPAVLEPGRVDDADCTNAADARIQGSVEGLLVVRAATHRAACARDRTFLGHRRRIFLGFGS